MRLGQLISQAKGQEKHMEKFLDKVTEINDVVNSFAWGWFALILLLGTGLVCTIITKCFQM